VLAQVNSGNWTLVEAAERLGLSYRQAKRLWSRYQLQGAAGLVHGSAGKPSNRAKPDKMRKKVIGLIRKKYSGEVGLFVDGGLNHRHVLTPDGYSPIHSIYPRALRDR
jgi:hypothetical protein